MKPVRLAFAMLAIAAAPALSGSPWISIELPANPLHDGMRGAYVIVRTYRHADQMPYLVNGTAEGIVNGERRSIPLTLTSTGRGGGMAVAKTWPNEGVWVLRLTIDGEDATAAIGVGSDGQVAFVRVPTSRQGHPRALARPELESMLGALAAGERVPSLQAAGLQHLAHQNAALIGIIIASGIAGAGAVSFLKRRSRSSR